MPARTAGRRSPRQAERYAKLADAAERDGAAAVEKAVADIPFQGLFRELSGYPLVAELLGRERPRRQAHHN